MHPSSTNQESVGASPSPICEEPGGDTLDRFPVADLCRVYLKQLGTCPEFLRLGDPRKTVTFTPLNGYRLPLPPDSQACL